MGLGYSADKSFHGACVLVVAFLAVVCLSTFVMPMINFRASGLKLEVPTIYKPGFHVIFQLILHYLDIFLTLSHKPLNPRP